MRIEQGSFCSQAHFIAFRWAQRKVLFESSGVIHGDHRIVRKYLIETRGVKCELCGIAEWRGCAVAVVADHINGNPLDNRIVNLRLVCPNCDAQLPTYKGKNRGNGRASRRERYAAGKTY